MTEGTITLRVHVHSDSDDVAAARDELTARLAALIMGHPVVCLPRHGRYAWFRATLVEDVEEITDLPPELTGICERLLPAADPTLAAARDDLALQAYQLGRAKGASLETVARRLIAEADEAVAKIEARNNDEP